MKWHFVLSFINVFLLFVLIFLVISYQNSELPKVDMHVQEQNNFIFTATPEPNSSAKTGIVINSKTGDIWKYWDQPQYGQIPGNWGLKYLGRPVIGQPDEITNSKTYSIK